MKKTFLNCALALALCVSMSGGAVMAEETDKDIMLISADTAVEPAVLMPVQVNGTVTVLEDGALYIKNDNEESIHSEVIARISEETAVVDAETGFAMNPADITDGSVVYAWLGNAMTMSIPPQSTAKVIVADVAEGTKAPAYYEITGTAKTEENTVTLPVLGGTELEISADTQLMPFMTRNIVTWDSLMPGSEILAWSDDEGNINKVLVFAYKYNGYLDIDGNKVNVSGMDLSAESNTTDEIVYAPLRAVAEAVGYEVSWTAEKGAIISYNGEEMISVLPDSDYATTSEGETYLIGKCIFDNDTAYIPAADIAFFLNLYFVK